MDYNNSSRRLQIYHDVTFTSGLYLEGVNGVNRLATKREKYYWLPTKWVKNYRLPTGKILTDYQHGLNKRYRDEHKDSILFLSNFFMAYIETQSLSKTVFKPTVWKRYVDDSFPLWDISKPDIVAFFAEQVNLHHPTMKFTAEISENETFFLETVVYQGTTFSEKWEKVILNVKRGCDWG